MIDKNDKDPNVKALIACFVGVSFAVILFMQFKGC